MAKHFKKSKGKKTKNYLHEDVMNALSKSGRKALNYKQIAAILKIEDHSQKLLIQNILEELVTRDIVKEEDRGKFKLNQNDQYIEGRIDMIASGAAFIVAEGIEDDVYIPVGKTASALHGDIVRVYVYPQRKGKKTEGEVTEVIKRAKTEFVGVIQLSPRFAFFVPDNVKMNTDIYIPLEKLNGAKDGQKVIAKITQWPEKAANPIGEIVEVLGNPGEHEVEIHAILAEYGLPYEFPKDVERVADLLPTEITEKDIAERRDFRDTTTFTIDPVDAKDFDDALSIKKLENGNWEIGVHIADVTHYVKPNSIIDKEGEQRATSVYLVDRVVPMLPEVLSNNVCSLRPNEEKLCFSAVFEMNDNAEIVNEWFGKTIIYSDRRFTYEEAQQVIETEQGDFAEEILTLDRLAKLLRAERFKKGSIAFDKIEVKFHIDQEGTPTGVFFKQQKDSNKLIEDFMLLANRKVAEYVGKSVRVEKNKKEAPQQKQQSAKPFVYRVHDSPNQDKLAAFADFVGKFGYKMSTKSSKDIAFSLNKLLQDVSGKKEENMIEQLAVRTMAKAIYTTKNIGHYGLAFDHYTHFTSPIRRYPDMMVHRLLKYYLDLAEGKAKRGENIDENELEEKCKHSSEMEKLAAEAERASIKYKQVEFLKDRVGEEFEALISGVTEWGIYAEIIENKCEGMIRLRDMRDDNFYFDEDNYAIKGKRTGMVYTLGDKLKIRIKRADVIRKQLDFEIAEGSSPKGSNEEENRPRRPKKPSKEPFDGNV